MDEMRFDGQVVIITGGTSGIGKCAAELIGKRGGTVVVASRTRTQETEEEFKAMGIKALGVPCDLVKEEERVNLVNTVMEKFGRIDALVNNSARGGRQQLFVDEGDEFEEVMQLNLYANRSLTKMVWPIMEKQGGGNIVMVLSASLLGEARNCAYAVSKGALMSLMRCVAFEGKEVGIKANGVLPCAFTPWAKRAVERKGYVGVAEWMQENVPAEAIAPIIAILAHKDCPCSGRAFNAEGGHFGAIGYANVLGYYSESLELEDVRDHFDIICGSEDTLEDLFAHCDEKYDMNRMIAESKAKFTVK